MQQANIQLQENSLIIIIIIIITSWFPGIVLTYFLNDFEMVPIAPIITGITLIFTFHIRCISYNNNNNKQRVIYIYIYILKFIRHNNQWKMWFWKL
jgi:hypothetical protein